MYQISSILVAASLLYLIGTSLTTPVGQVPDITDNAQSETASTTPFTDSVIVQDAESATPEAATFGQTPESVTPSQSSDSGDGGFSVVTPSSNRPPAEVGKIITTRFGADGVTPEQQCRCSLDYACNAQHVVTLSGDQSCPVDTVCCMCVQNLTNPLPVTGGLCINTDDPVVLNPPASSGNDCSCVSDDRCDPTVSRIQAKQDSSPKCEIKEFCCPWENMLNTTKSTEYQCGRRTLPVEGPAVYPKAASQFGEFPWMALIYKSEVSADGQKNLVFVCGASLLSPTVVLTAAHCVKYMNNDTRVRVGEFDLNVENAEAEPKPHQDQSISVIIQHKNFDPVNYHNDFALLVVSERFEFDSHISPICLSSVNSEFQLDTLKVDTSRCVATGWGKNVFDRTLTYQKTLKQVPLSVIDKAHCEKALKGTRLGSNFTLHSSLLCAGGKPGIDVCKGDGGGPLVCPLIGDPNRFVQVGITAAGVSCGLAVPGLYASLLDADSLSWLASQFVVSTPSQRSRFN